MCPVRTDVACPGHGADTRQGATIRPARGIADLAASPDMARIWFSLEELEAVLRALPEDIEIRNHALAQAVRKISAAIDRQRKQAVIG